jgi:hypothetical protein
MVLNGRFWFRYRRVQFCSRSALNLFGFRANVICFSTKGKQYSYDDSSPQPFSNVDIYTKARPNFALGSIVGSRCSRSSAKADPRR